MAKGDKGEMFLHHSEWIGKMKSFYKRCTIQTDCILCLLHTDTQSSHIHRSFLQSFLWWSWQFHTTVWTTNSTYYHSDNGVKVLIVEIEHSSPGAGWPGHIIQKIHSFTINSGLVKAPLDGNKGNTPMLPLYNNSCPSTNTLMDSKAIIEKDHTVWVSDLIKMCWFWVTDWPPTGHNDLNVDKQPNLKKSHPLRESKFILFGDNIVNIRSCMTYDHPTHTLHPILRTASAHLARGNSYHATYSCQNCQHSTLLAYWPPTLSRHLLQAWHYKFRQCHLSDMTCTKPTVCPGHQSLSAKPWQTMNMHFPTTILQQTWTNYTLCTVLE